MVVTGLGQPLLAVDAYVCAAGLIVFAFWFALDCFVSDLAVNKFSIVQSKKKAWCVRPCNMYCFTISPLIKYHVRGT